MKIKLKSGFCLCCLCGIAFETGALAQTRVLVLGSSNAYQDSEAAFPPASVASSLQGILAGDAAISQPATVEVEDIVKTDTVSPNFSSHTLMSWFYWPDAHQDTLDLLANNWDSVVLLDDPHVASRFPEYHFEGVMRISKEVRKSGGTPISVMLWSSGAYPVAAFGEMAYRVGDAADIPVAPAGFAWDALDAALKDEGTRPTARGAYVTAAAIYSRLYDRSAKASSYLPTGVTESDRDAIADSVYATVQAESTKNHYAGVLRRPTHFAEPLNKKRHLNFGTMRSSSENGIGPFSLRDKILPLARVSSTWYTGPDYQTFPNLGWQLDFCLSRYHHIADPEKWRHYASFDYQDSVQNDGSPEPARTMVTGMDRVMYPYPLPYSSIGANNVTDYWIDRGEFFVPVRLMWARIVAEHPEIVFQDDGHHMTQPVRDGIATMMYTLLSGRCPIGDEPADANSAAWQSWYCRKVGYEVAWQQATLQNRVPGFEVLPSATAATELNQYTPETLTVRFRYPPTSDVTVTMQSPDRHGELIADPVSLTFTPENYATPQTVELRMAGDADFSGTVTVSCNTASDDTVFDALYDEWAYTAVESTTTHTWSGGNAAWDVLAAWTEPGAPGTTSQSAGFNDSTKNYLGANYLRSNRPIQGIQYTAGLGAAGVRTRLHSNLSGNAASTLTLGNSPFIRISSGSSGNHVLGDTAQYDRGNVVLSDTLTVTHNGSGTYSINCPVGGAGGIVKNGSGTVILGAANTYTGATTVNAGTLALGAASLGDASDLYLNGEGTLHLDFSGTDTIRTLYLDGLPQAAGTWGASGSDADHTTAAITGTGLLEIVDDGKFWLELKPGWNAFSIPLVLDDPRESAVFARVQPPPVVWEWNGKRFVIAEQLQHGRGYWCFLDDVETLLLQGRTTAQSETPNLNPGWNFIGVGEDASIDDFPEARSPIRSWNGSVHQRASIMTPGSAYWLFVP